MVRGALWRMDQRLHGRRLWRPVYDLRQSLISRACRVRPVRRPRAAAICFRLAHESNFPHAGPRPDSGCCGLLLLLSARTSAAATVELSRWLDHLERLIPKQAAMFSVGLPADVAKATDGVEQWSVITQPTQPDQSPGEGWLPVLSELLDAKDRCDRLLDRAFDQRSQFVTLAGSPIQRDAIRSYLHSTARLIDLSGRVRYLLSDALNGGVAELSSPAQRDRLLDLLMTHRSSIGAHAAVRGLLEPLPASQRAVAAAEPAIIKLLRLIGSSGQSSLLPQLAQFLNRPDISPALRIAAVEAIEEIGLPQDPRQGSPADTPAYDNRAAGPRPSGEDQRRAG